MAEEFVEAALRRPRAGSKSEVPFSEETGRVAAALQEGGQQDFARRKLRGVVVLNADHVVHSSPERMPTGEEGRPRRRTDRMGIEGRAANALRGQPVEDRRQHHSAIAAEILIALVVGDDDEDVGLLRRRVGSRQRGQRRQQQSESEQWDSFHSGSPVAGRFRGSSGAGGATSPRRVFPSAGSRAGAA